MQKKSVTIQDIKSIDKKKMSKYNKGVFLEDSDFPYNYKKECGLLDEAYNQR